jgi:glycosyltransferase involved in cell wall biosynthesis
MPMRVAVVHSFYSSRQPSGENMQVMAEVEALREAGLEVAVVGVRTDDLESDPFYGLRCAARVATGRGASPIEAIETFGADIVHVHNLFPNFGRRWVRDLAVPFVATVHNFRFTCASGTLVRDGRGCTDCPDGDRWSALRHRCYRGSLAATLPLAISQRRGASADPVLAHAARIICFSPRQRRMLELGRISPERLVDGNNFLPASLEPGPLGRAGPHRHGAVYVGRLTREKGVVDLVRCWRGGTILRIIGEGPELAEVTRAARRRNVVVLGGMERSDVIEQMMRSAVLVMPGATPEVAPLTFVEALACSLPVVVRDTADIGAPIAANGLGEIVAAVEDFPDAVERVAADPTTPARCRAYHEARHTKDAWVDRALGLYTDVTGRVPAS